MGGLHADGEDGSLIGLRQRLTTSTPARRRAGVRRLWRPACYDSCMSNDQDTGTTAIAAADPKVRAALAHGQVIDITTIGRRTGAARRIEIVFHVIDGRIYISGMPRRATRAWLLNLRADPRLTVHLKGAVRADLPATAREVTDETERRSVFGWIVDHAWRQQDVEMMTRYSPLIEVRVEAAAA